MANPFRLVVVRPALVLLAYRERTLLRKTKRSSADGTSNPLVTTLVRYNYFFKGTIQRRYSFVSGFATGATLNPQHLVAIAEVF